MEFSPQICVEGAGSASKRYLPGTSGSGALCKLLNRLYL